MLLSVACLWNSMGSLCWPVAGLYSSFDRGDVGPVWLSPEINGGSGVFGPLFLFHLIRGNKNLTFLEMKKFTLTVAEDECLLLLCFLTLSCRLLMFKPLCFFMCLSFPFLFSNSQPSPLFPFVCVHACTCERECVRFSISEYTGACVSESSLTLKDRWREEIQSQLFSA